LISSKFALKGEKGAREEEELSRSNIDRSRFLDSYAIVFILSLKLFEWPKT
jgi:hypothetical protein